MNRVCLYCSSNLIKNGNRFICPKCENVSYNYGVNDDTKLSTVTVTTVLNKVTYAVLFHPEGNVRPILIWERTPVDCGFNFLNQKFVNKITPNNIQHKLQTYLTFS